MSDCYLNIYKISSSKQTKIKGIFIKPFKNMWIKNQTDYVIF